MQNVVELAQQDHHHAAMTRFTSPFLSLVAVLALSHCSSQSGGQTGSELSCVTDSDCTDALGAEYVCGTTMICVSATGTADAGSVDAPIDVAGCWANTNCPGSGPGGEPMICQREHAYQACGIPPQQACADNPDCGTGVCDAIADSCSPSGIGSACLADTCAGRQCPEGFSCVDGNGWCKPSHCDEGYVCPRYQVCDPNAGRGGNGVARYEEHHGCVDVVCTADAECATALPSAPFCVAGRCDTDLGECIVEPPPVP